MTDYGSEFYEAYEDYLQEPSVRERHELVFDMAFRREVGLRVIDLGCGQSLEFPRFGPPSLYRYQGYDVNAPASTHPLGYKTEVADYRSPDFIKRVSQLDWEPNVFVSLFSAECTAPAQENMGLYERLFREIPTFQYGLVAGFYYTDRRHENPVEEAGGVVSWQTLSQIGDSSPSKLFEETRIVTRVPSKMFGENVVEVWRLFERR